MQENETNPALLEIKATEEVYKALKDLEVDAQIRVIDHVSKILGIKTSGPTSHKAQDIAPIKHENNTPTESYSDELEASDSLQGISPIAKKWITRSDLSIDDLAKLFSLGLDEIDLVATSVPGKSKREKSKNIFLLKGIAAYLSSGSPRFNHENLKETLLHYDAFDLANFAKYLTSMASSIGGSKESGYQLTARGIAEATTLIKEMIGS
ncbi:hypothetical protein [Leptospira yasudae]|uniref:hypothetical protein n=1 Tax=Leptospira yasudae TaxID=2202201 RepID=UPI0010915385|nr:hypothetical protein [Leptospira yasudae]TGM99935.1 hypothetical protein EHR10_08735 [Leptospira yasudae]